jgi:hypothetical protein
VGSRSRMARTTSSPSSRRPERSRRDRVPGR